MEHHYQADRPTAYQTINLRKSRLEGEQAGFLRTANRPLIRLRIEPGVDPDRRLVADLFS